jgi:hypothetical protein
MLTECHDTIFYGNFFVIHQNNIYIFVQSIEQQLKL